MPIHVPPMTRRSFLVRSSAAMAGLMVCRQGWSAEGSDPNLFAILSDTHIDANPATIARTVNMTDNLNQVVQEIGKLGRKPAGLILNGDCAYNRGLPGDYQNLAKGLEPVRKGGIPLHLLMGNHDDHEPLYSSFADQRAAMPPVSNKLISVIETPFADIVLLDTQKAVNVVTGEIGETQLKWLAEALDARKEKPVIVFAHHNMQFVPPESGKPWGGIQDTEAFYELLKSRKQVKAFFYGHSHRWHIEQKDGIHLVNLPPVAYVFNPELPNGWVLAQLNAKGIGLHLHTIAADHKLNNQKVDLTWLR
ncbi:metallophosphoesterase family protein [Planctomicrobium sp. SH527]|uniref:metallophosphoesterase family protein n=1 Tax=Planctomicrobium sp. SH527 TaxID=3448123 RepID=UPI003F5CA229